jgi:hypothetical protein
LLRITERDSVKMLEFYTDVFAVPLNPDQIRGKRIVVEREFTPIYKVKHALEDAAHRHKPSATTRASSS